MIRIVEDVGAPALVAGVDLVTLETMPQYNEWATYIMAGGGYLGALLDFGGPFIRQVGVAAAPLAIRAIRDRIKAGTQVGLPFNPIRQSTFPEMANVRVA